MSVPFEFVANDERDTDRFGAALAQVLPSGAVVALVGTLGAGKTRLVQAVAKAAGVDPSEVLSPTFVLVHEYRVPGFRRGGHAQFRVQAQKNQSDVDTTANQKSGETRSQLPVPVIYHIDAYRIRDDDEFRELGPEEYFESDGWTFIEWADRVSDCLPREHLEINIAVTGLTTRRFGIVAHGRTFDAVATVLQSVLKPILPLDQAVEPRG
jgi:tRNA threonylcarbamoyladenosine biosynthesis protein TsaE